jgi:hypothetical protein
MVRMILKQNINLERAREVLGDNGKYMTDKEIVSLLTFLYSLSDKITQDSLQEGKYAD